MGCQGDHLESRPQSHLAQTLEYERNEKTLSLARIKPVRGGSARCERRGAECRNESTGWRRSSLREVTPPGVSLSETKDSQDQGGNRLLNLERLIDHEFLLIDEFT